jgi:hypothetical protein
MIIQILLIDFHAVTDPAGNRAMDGCHVLGQCSSVYTKRRKKHIIGAHGLYRGIILVSCVAARALRMHRSITIVLFERTCVRVGPITNTAGESSRSNWTMDGGGVLWPMLRCL